MKLKKITVNGFKSFADKTTFDFGDGVTVVVGPNGCGKSNIVDAVKWVLGEQSAKSLRGGQMLDVLFNGTNTRKSTSMAEVVLVFSNEDGMLAIDAEEVSVTRRLYRSGESDYMLNNKACRLKDIREMFMGTGIGADAYSIIEQGKVTTLLHTSKKERRAIFEEAAGISRYKARKKEAERKLERTDQNVLRIQDILEELEKRLRSVKNQAGKARNYQTYSERLKELRMSQFLAEYYKLENATGEFKERMNVTQDDLMGVTAESETVQTRLSLLDHELDKCDEEIHQVDGRLLQCTSQISTQEERIEMGHRRCQELQELLDKGRKQTQGLRDQGNRLRGEMAGDQEKIQQLQIELENKQQDLGALQDARQERLLQLNEYRAQLEDEKTGVIDIVRRTAQLHNEIKSLDLRRDNLSGQKDRLNDRTGKINEEMAGYLSQKAMLDEKAEEIRTLLDESQGQMQVKREQLAQLSEERLVCSENLSAAKESRSGLISRQQLLQDLEAKLEGVDQGVRTILQARQKDPEKFYYVKGMIAEVIRADVQYASIIEAALAQQAQHLVVTSSKDVLDDRESLEELKGRVKMIALDHMPGQGDGLDLGAWPAIKGRLSELVNCADEYKGLAEHILGRTLLVEDMETALSISKQIPAGYRWITLAGELLEADGTMHFGPNTGQTGLISRKSELRQLETSIAETDERIQELQYQSEQYASQAQHLEKNLQELRTAIYEANTEEIETRSHLEQLDNNINRLKQEQPLIVSEIQSLEEQIQESLTLQRSSQDNLEELEVTNQQRQEQIETLEEVIQQLEGEDQVVVEQLTELKVSQGQVQQQRLALQERITSLQSQLQQCRHNMKTLETDISNAQENYQTTQRAILKANSMISELFMVRQQEQETARVLRNQRHELHMEKESLGEKNRELNRSREELQERLHETQMQLNENNLRRENLCQRSKEDLDVELEECFRSYEYEDMDWSAVSKEIDELRGKISRLGNINLDAITEQEELEERLEYLNKQYKDLTEAKKQLEELIETINHESTELFIKNFETIKVNFAELFRKLFGGGRAEIILEDPNDVLECGIEIVARPPGKQPQSISLLSGGEKTMTAVALLMAIFKSKPSPFCLLDEVDAALDEANIERFNLVVLEFLEKSQFIIITHARRTMSIADVIYGVTMQEQGVSKKVSVKFSGDDEGDDGEPDNAVA